MFAGIIEAIAAIKAVRTTGKGCIVRIEIPARWRLTIGQSIAVDGICSTVIATGGEWFEVEYMPESLKKTTVVSFVKGRMVHLERSLRVGDRVDGHFVLGHVDARASVSKVERQGSSRLITVKVPARLASFIAPIGSITLSGVALTIAASRGTSATVALIPYTLAHTNLGALRPGDVVNVEVDLVARYLAAQHKR